MQITFHGGRCCGIKHICWFQHWHPNLEMPAKKAKEVKEPEDEFDDDDDYQSTSDVLYDPTVDGEEWHVDGNLDWFCEEAPAEPAEERFERYVEFIRKNQPGCLVEVCLSSHDFCDNSSAWEAIILKHGFKPVGPRFTNSNTGNKIQVYHLILKG